MARSRSSARSTSRQPGATKPPKSRQPDLVLERPSPSRRTRKTILIATEDTGSGRHYLESIAREVRQWCSISFAPHRGSNPRSVYKAAKDSASDGPYNEVWLIFDTEGPQNTNRMNEARDVIESARQIGFSTAISNPCLEYWFILHFEKCTDPLVDGEAASHRLRRQIPGYDKGTDCYPPTRPLLGDARRNAKELYKERCVQNAGHPCDCHPCTQMFALMDSLFGE